MNEIALQLLTALIGQAVGMVPQLIKQFADPHEPDPVAPPPTDPSVQQAISTIAATVAHGIAAAAYQASLDRPHASRRDDTPHLPTAP